MRKPMIRPLAIPDVDVAQMLLDVVRSAVAVPHGLRGAQLVFASSMDREYFFAVRNSFETSQ